MSGSKKRKEREGKFVIERENLKLLKDNYQPALTSKNQSENLQIFLRPLSTGPFFPINTQTSYSQSVTPDKKPWIPPSRSPTPSKNAFATCIPSRSVTPKKQSWIPPSRSPTPSKYAFATSLCNRSVTPKKQSWIPPSRSPTPSKDAFAPCMRSRSVTPNKKTTTTLTCSMKPTAPVTQKRLTVPQKKPPLTCSVELIPTVTATATQNRLANLTRAATLTEHEPTFQEPEKARDEDLHLINDSDLSCASSYTGKDESWFNPQGIKSKWLQIATISESKVAWFRTKFKLREISVHYGQKSCRCAMDLCPVTYRIKPRPDKKLEVSVRPNLTHNHTFEELKSNKYQSFGSFTGTRISMRCDKFNQQ
jgi:hypothetical protein